MKVSVANNDLTLRVSPTQNLGQRENKALRSCVISVSGIRLDRQFCARGAAKTTKRIAIPAALRRRSRG